MKFYDKQPTIENVVESILSDNFGRDKIIMKFVQRINQLLSIDGIDKSISLSIDGDWGTGKTFFVKQLLLAFLLRSTCVDDSFYNNIKITEEDRKAINSKLENAEKVVSINDNDILDLTVYKPIKLPIIPIYYDAWKNDNSEEPVLSLINEIVKSTNVIKGLYGKADVKEGLFELLKGVFNSISINVGPVTVNGTGISDIFSSMKENFSKPDYLSFFEEQDELHNSINKFLQELLKDNNKLIIFIDEIDRCKPTFAISLLERIKHYFDNPNIIFVFSTNFKELTNTVKKAYGENINADRYLDRFFDVKLTLPEIDVISYLNYLECNPNGNDISFICYLFRYFNFSMREVNIFWNNYYLSRPLTYKLQQSGGNMSDSTTIVMIKIIVPILTSLKIIKCSEYQDFINGEKPELFVEILKPFKNLDNYIYNTKNFATNLKLENEEFISLFLRELYFHIFDPRKRNPSFWKSLGVDADIYLNRNIAKHLIDCITLISTSNAID